MLDIILEDENILIWLYLSLLLTVGICFTVKYVMPDFRREYLKACGIQKDETPVSVPPPVVPAPVYVKRILFTIETNKKP